MENVEAEQPERYRSAIAGQYTAAAFHLIVGLCIGLSASLHFRNQAA